MDESVINGALLFFPEQFGISTTVGPGVTAAQAATNQWLVGLVTSAPYVSLTNQRNDGDAHSHLLNLKALLRRPWMLVDGSSQRMAWTTWYNFSHRHDLISDVGHFPPSLIRSDSDDEFLSI